MRETLRQILHSADTSPPVRRHLGNFHVKLCCLVLFISRYALPHGEADNLFSVSKKKPFTASTFLVFFLTSSTSHGTFFPLQSATTCPVINIRENYHLRGDLHRSTFHGYFGFDLRTHSILAILVRFVHLCTLLQSTPGTLRSSTVLAFHFNAFLLVAAVFATHKKFF